MNKIIFQIGLLAFFVSLVVFTNQIGSVFEAVARSFLVFIGVIVFSTLVLGVSMLFTSQGTRRLDQKKFSKPEGQEHAGGASVNTSS